MNEENNLLRGAGSFLNIAQDMTMGAQLLRAARRCGSKIAFQLGDEERSYKQLEARVGRLGQALIERGVKAGDRVAVLMTNSIETAEAYFGIVHIGAICVPINFRLAPAEIGYILADCDACALIADVDLIAAAMQVRDQLSSLRTLIVVGSSSPTVDCEEFEAVIAQISTVATPSPRVELQSPAFIMYTSGTTGKPKGAVLSHYNLLMQAINMTAAQEIMNDDDRYLIALPLFHIGGLNGVLPFLLKGGTCILQSSGTFDALATVDLLEREKVTSCFMVPTQWHAICAVPGVQVRDFALQRILWGASPAPPSVLKALAETFPGVRQYNVFGQTEIGGTGCAMRADLWPEKFSSIGKATLLFETRIVNDDMQDVAPGETGEIVYRGPAIMQGYWNKPQANEEAFAGGWFHSGDLVREDEDGFIYVVDRKKDMIISGGENIYCQEVEAVIDTHPAVREVAIIGVPHSKWVETPIAIVAAINPAQPPSEAEIIEWCRDRLASYKKPSRVIFTDVLPRNASGKVLKVELRARYASSGI